MCDRKPKGGWKMKFKGKTKWETNILVLSVLLVARCTITEGMEVACSFVMDSFASTGSIYFCRGTVVGDISNENVTAVNGTHAPGKGNKDVLGINLTSQRLEVFPTNMETFFPNLIAIFFFNNNITTVSRRHLAPFPRLNMLWLLQNRITSIDGDLFAGMTSLEAVSFETNNITHVGHELNLPIDGVVRLGGPCLRFADARTPDDVARLKLRLLDDCPPTISQIADSMRNQQNFLGNIVEINDQLRYLSNTVNEIRDVVATLRNDQSNLSNEVEELSNRLVYLDEMNDELEKMRIEQLNLVNRISYLEEDVIEDLINRILHLERIIENKVETEPVVSLIN
ncbi:Protein slit [Pseudolycoriella hygida]|uniref:Protein slit n=1 Tax=Pseudolycoriella hygida TaxID=35572 RepID=A0A9Q0NFW8_9DIPT|nr:Protein slit [Pseudolycoriella hygida]